MVPVRLDEDFEYACAGPNPADLLFVTSEGETLDHELDEWTVHAEAVVWVRLPVLDPSGASLWMYYGHRSATHPPPAAVWSADVGFEAVFHFADSLEDARGEHDGEVVERNAVSTYNEGRLGRAIRFEDANVGSRVELGSPALIDQRMATNEALTVTAWIRSTPNVTADELYRTVFSRGEGAWALSVRDGDGEFPFDFEDSAQSAFYSAPVVEGGDPFLVGTTPVINDELLASWHHVAIRYERIDRSTLRKSLYVDGVPDGSVEGPASIPWATLTSQSEPRITIGSANSGGNIFHGDIDEVHIASVAWTPERIAAEFELVANEGLVSLWSPECQ